jgi:hypothetical protein
MTRIALILVLAILAPVALAACGSNQIAPATTAPTRETTRNGAFVVSYKPETGVVPLNKLHSWTVHVATPSGRPVDNARITVDGGMPDMGHGLPTSPRITSLGGGDYRVRGMEFTMPGAWSVTFTVTAASVSDKATFSLYVQ